MAQSDEIESWPADGDDDLELSAAGNDDPDDEEDLDDEDLDLEDEDLDEDEDDEEEDDEDEDEDEEDEDDERSPHDEEEDDDDDENSVDDPPEARIPFEERYLDDIQDEFANFIDDELGYSDVDWDSLPEKEVDLHKEIRAMSKAQLAKVKLKGVSDFARWAVARTYLEHGDVASFIETTEPLLSSKKRSPALDYVDIALSLVSRLAQEKKFSEAEAVISKLGDLAPSEKMLQPRFAAILTIQKGDRADGLEMLAKLAEENASDLVFLLSIGEDLCGLQLWDEALEYLEIAEELARSENNKELLASAQNAASFAKRHIGYHDAAPADDD
ncbi:MAG: hypothetical protein KC561_05670 [Myxococcales bacterium]|nr:hypothetical protein [Myxococcales bacterium]